MDAIIISCNVFAPRIDDVRPFVSVPILTVDSAMQNHAASIGGRIGVLGTNRSSVPSCCGGIRRAAAALGLPDLHPFFGISPPRNCRCTGWSTIASSGTA